MLLAQCMNAFSTFTTITIWQFAFDRHFAPAANYP